MEENVLGMTKDVMGCLEHSNLLSALHINWLKYVRKPNCTLLRFCTQTQAIKSTIFLPWWETYQWMWIVNLIKAHYYCCCTSNPLRSSWQHDHFPVQTAHGAPFTAAVIQTNKNRVLGSHNMFVFMIEALFLKKKDLLLSIHWIVTNVFMRDHISWKSAVKNGMKEYITYHCICMQESNSLKNMSKCIDRWSERSGVHHETELLPDLALEVCFLLHESIKEQSLLSCEVMIDRLFTQQTLCAVIPGSAFTASEREKKKSQVTTHSLHFWI